MANEVIWKIVLNVIGFLTTTLCGYLLAKIKDYRRRDNNQQEALKCLLRSAISSKYYVYTELGMIPTYEKENLVYMYEQYKNMKGNSYIDNIIKEIERLPIKK